MNHPIYKRLEEYAARFVEAAASDIAQAEQIVIYHEGGFGHQLNGPDLVRRFYAPKQCLFIAVTWNLRHNQLTPLIWSGIRVLHVLAAPDELMPDAAPFINLNSVVWAERLAWLIHRRIAAGWPIPTVNQAGLFQYVAASYIAPYRRTLSDGSHQSINWMPAYFSLVQKIPAPKCRLPEELRVIFTEHIKSKFNITQKVATFYLRQKGGEASSLMRSGSNPREYMLTFQLLEKEGYTTFVTGDFSFNTHNTIHVDQIVKSMLECGFFPKVFALLERIDPVNFNLVWRTLASDQGYQILRSLAELYVKTECDVFIGEAGGGTQLTPYNGTPTLNVNVLPHGVAMPNTTHLYKMVLDKNDTPLPLSSLFGKYKWEVEFPEARIRDNTSLEIAEAVITMTSSIRQHPVGVGKDGFLGASEELWILYSNAVVSPAYFRARDRATASVQKE